MVNNLRFQTFSTLVSASPSGEGLVIGRRPRERSRFNVSCRDTAPNKQPKLLFVLGFQNKSHSESGERGCGGMLLL